MCYQGEIDQEPQSATHPLSRFQLSELPPEILQEILTHVQPCSVLPFAVTCRKNYSLALPIFHRQVTLNPPTLYSFHISKVASNDPSIVWVRDAELRYTRRGRYDRRQATVDEIATLKSLISSLPLLTSLNITSCFWRLRGWSDFSAIIQMLPATFESLGVNITCIGEHAFNTNASGL